MATSPAYASTPRIGIGVVGIGDTSRVNPVNYSTVFTAGSSGSRIDNIDIVGQGTTTATMVRLWDFDGSKYRLWREVTAAATTASASGATLTINYSSQDNTTFLPLILPSGHSLRASVNDTQTGAAALSLATVGASQSISASAAAILNGSAATSANTTSVAAGATQAGPAFYTLTSAVVYTGLPAVISLTSTGNISGVNFTITGTNASGGIISETIAGPNNNTVFGSTPFVSISAVFCSAAVGTSTSVGVASFCTLPAPSKLSIASSGSLVGVNFTVIGIDESGANISETLTGPAAGAIVTSVNTYRSICKITPNGAVSEVRFGTTYAPFGFTVYARGADF